MIATLQNSRYIAQALSLPIHPICLTPEHFAVHILNVAPTLSLACEKEPDPQVITAVNFKGDHSRKSNEYTIHHSENSK